ncbi:hypothetical protein JOQ06_002347 [Pogonophryne albipinna]|uniref:Uncharacterized protein n=1 Tax=Pogonophryne albipinna TaxID=1090488 RepID=A0AAD6B6T9_9TELE|nr:hypothetical protein JOQ06_002346 [Pogonophryne albipinna]KAJ4937715.1 hypothetical protein JOQ06_002347 [Pogonophryne albipinna]
MASSGPPAEEHLLTRVTRWFTGFAGGSLWPVTNARPGAVTPPEDPVLSEVDEEEVGTVWVDAVDGLQEAQAEPHGGNGDSEQPPPAAPSPVYYPVHYAVPYLVPYAVPHAVPYGVPYPYYAPMTSPCAYPSAAPSPYAAPHAYPYAAPSPYAAPHAYPYAAPSPYAAPHAYPYAAPSPYAAPHAYPSAAPSPYAAPHAYPYAAPSPYAAPHAYPYAAPSPYAAPHAYPYAAPSPYAAPHAYPYAAAAYPQAAAYDDPSYYANPLDDVEDPAVEAFLNRYLDGQSSEDEEEYEDVTYGSPVFVVEDIKPLSLEDFSEEPEVSVVPGSPSCYGPGYSRRRCREISDEEGEEESAAKRRRRSEDCDSD